MHTALIQSIHCEENKSIINKYQFLLTPQKKTFDISMHLIHTIYYNTTIVANNI